MRSGVIFDLNTPKRFIEKSSQLASNNASRLSALPRRIGSVIQRTGTRNPSKLPPTHAEHHQEKLENLIDNSGKVLLSIKAVFPFNFFPDRLTIDVNKVNIVKKNFFLSERRHSVSIKMITEIYTQTSPFFATLYIVDSALNMGNKLGVPYLWKKDAEKARRLIQGLVDTAKQDIDLSQMSAEEIIDKLGQAGKIRTK